MFGAPKSSKKAAPAWILVVDDEPDCLSIIKCRLEWCNYVVSMAGNGEDALRMVEDEQPDLILLDTNMPVMNGHDMLGRMRKNPVLKDIPVIMVTALCEKQDIAAASAYDIADYVTKPIDFDSLLDKISNTLGRKASKAVKK